MDLKLNRITSDSDATLGTLWLDGVFFCFTLEDEYRQAKVPHETRIPSGRYQIRLQKSGRIHERYAQRFPSLHKGTLMLQDVPGFSGVAIHIGNHDDDTDGCILVGMGAIVGQSETSITDSTRAYKNLYRAVYQPAQLGQLYIHIEDHDR